MSKSIHKCYRDISKDIIKIEAHEDGGFKLEVKNPDGTEWGGNYYGLVSHGDLQNLEGKLLTIIDATFSDLAQRKAMKDIIRRTIWFDWAEHIYKGRDNFPVGMPLEPSI